MKFKVEPKDFLIFIGYAVALLYLCAILVLNLTSFANSGEFYGFLPFKAFTPDYFPATMTVFFGAVILIFTSVSSYIFDKEKGKGVGLKVEKKGGGDGYSKWSSEKDIIAQKGVEKVIPSDMQVTAAGVPLISNDKGIYVDNGQYHNLVLGSTGSGKTVCLVKPMVNLLARKGESMVITDPKGELYKDTAESLKAKGYNIVLLNFREPQKGNAWNPLSLPYLYHKEGNRDKSIELLNDVALNILYDEGNKNDPFWEKTASDYFAGITLGLFEDANEKEVNLNSINYMSTIGEERYAANSTYVKEYFTLKGESSKPYILASATISAPNETKGSILSTFRQKISMFSTKENLSEMLSFSDFDMRDIGRKKTAVFLVIHDEKKTYHSLMTIFIKQCYETLIDVAHEHEGKLPFRTNFILDEFANMPALKDVDAMVSAARSRDIRFTFIIQNFAQLSAVYGEHIAEIIKGNCGNLIYLISTEMKALEEISKMCGEVKSKEKDKTASTPLITVSDLQKLKLFQAIIIRLRTNPFKTQLKPSFKINWGEDFPQATYPLRTLQEVKMFDVKKYVTEEKKKQALENGGNPNSPMGGGFNPFMGGMGSNPFASNPFGSNPFASNPFGPSTGASNPFAPKPSAPNQGMNNPFAPSPSGPNQDNKPLGNIDIDEMMKDIDRKLKELDEQEKLEKEKLEKERLEKEEKAKAAQAEELLEEKPTVNVDVDSKIVADKVVSDDEFFDDFFE